MDGERPRARSEGEAPGSMLRQAAIFNNVDFLTSLLQGDEQDNVNAQDTYGRSALYTCVDKNSIECAHMLLQAGADPNLATGPQCDGMTALHAAAMENKQPMVSLLLQYGADMNITDLRGRTPIELAKERHSEECIHILQLQSETEEKKFSEIEKEFLKACLDGDVAKLKRLTSGIPHSCVRKAVNIIPEGVTSLLHRACDGGNVAMVKFLLRHGIQIQVHPVTGQTPLHAACIAGYPQCVTELLKFFPELIRAPTIDGTLPLHVAAEHGHSTVVDIILNYPYPEFVKKIFKETNGERMYRLGFAVTAKDGHGKTPLHLAVSNNHPQIVKQLLDHQVPVMYKYNEGVIKDVKAGRGASPDVTDATSHAQQQQNARVNKLLNTHNRKGVHVENGTEASDLLSDLTEANEITPPTKKSIMFSPVAADIDSRDLEGNTPLHIAVKGDGAGHGYCQAANILLHHRANPNKPIISPSGNISCLMEACLNEDPAMVNLFLKYGAKDDDGSVIAKAIKSENEDLISVFLKQNTHIDAAYKVNAIYLLQKQGMDGSIMLQSGMWTGTWSTQSFKHIWPNSPVVINWHGLSLPFVTKQWLLDACNSHIGRPPVSDPDPGLILFSITRLDLSNNNLTFLPQEVFNLPSLRTLNVAQNNIKWIPGCQIDFPRSCSCLNKAVQRLDPDSKISSHANDCEHKVASQKTLEETNSNWDCPVLEDVSLHYNKLKSLPKALFQLQSLKKLNVSHNEIEVVPFELWTAESLTELNLSHNELKCLPSCSDEVVSRSSTLSSHLGEQLDYSGLSGQSSPSTIGSLPGTPKRQLDSSPIPPQDGSDRASPLPPTPEAGSLTDISNQSGASGKSHDVIPITNINHFHNKVTIKATTYGDDNQGAHDKSSNLSELNLSHNKLSKVPDGLACLAPKLTKLLLTHNRMSEIGPLDNLPVNMKWLDMSSNGLLGEMMFVVKESDVDMPWRSCFSPYYTSRRGVSKTPIMSRANTRSRSNSGTPGISNPLTIFICPHRQHRTLEKLKTLKLGCNKLSKFDLIMEKDSSLESSLDSYSSTSSSDTTKTKPEQKPVLLYPNLSVLDLSYNNLSTVTADISLQFHLTELRIGYNKQLRELPSEIGLLKKLWSLDFTGCPAEKSLMSVLGEKVRKTAAVKGYLKSIKELATNYNRMKLMFVGTQGIGKTSLLNQLRKEGKTSSSKPKNWAQRMGHTTMQDTDQYGENISTVGVDISDLVIQRNNKEVVFRTWDFGGQREYYATHQYFLSKRSLYLVVWKVTDGEKGVNDILQWLVNIQARARNSPVIIVGTHMDLITKKKYPPNYIQDLQKLIFDKYMCHAEPEKSGLPRVLGHIEISCKSRIMFNNHISELTKLILDVAFEEQLPGSKGTKLLEQSVPASYVFLQDVVSHLADERKALGKDPVLHAEQYKMMCMLKMEELHGTSFRDLAELNQGTQFLHENGVLLHYEDVNLQDIYFLDPQWLCDMLANVVTIREINSLAICGIMRTEDLKILFKNASFKPEDIKTYIIDLLNKFEVALMWDESNLLIPSLLPTVEDIRRSLPNSDVRIPVKGCTNQKAKPRIANIVIESEISLNDKSTEPTVSNPNHPTFYANPIEQVRHLLADRPTDLGVEPAVQVVCPPQNADEFTPTIVNNYNPATSLVRLYLMSYFPSGFWPRLITRLLADETFYGTSLSMYEIPDVLLDTGLFTNNPSMNPEWKCWQTGVELKHLGVTILRVQEVAPGNSKAYCDYRQCSLVIRQETDTHWSRLNLMSTSILEIVIPNESLSAYFNFGGQTSSEHNESLVIQPNAQVIATLLTKIVDHVDMLLEDWYPNLGARFEQNSRGMYLITRVVPCTRCLLMQINLQKAKLNTPEAWSVVDIDPGERTAQITQPIYINQTMNPAVQNVSGSADAGGDTPQLDDTEAHSESVPANMGSTTWMDALYNQGVRVVDTMESAYNKTVTVTGVLPRIPQNTSFAFTVETCIVAAEGSNRCIICPIHGKFQLDYKSSYNSVTLVPDVVFQDIGDHCLVDQDLVTRGRFLGKGAFGAVYAGTMTEKRTNDQVCVAMKMMQPVSPGSDASQSIRQQYVVEKQKWDKDPLKNACEAYLNARKELSILLSLSHENIVPLLGISLHPLCLILSLAPQGALKEKLMDYQRAGDNLAPLTIACIVGQVASALEYLHFKQIIYRDLKSENVLVWSIPPPYCEDPSHPVEVKLADYGVSRSVLPSGAKGLVGTLPFIAPEIIQHNGEESYTEKVDIFSFGMFMYELLVLKIPFEGEGSSGGGGANLKGHVLLGGRPFLTRKELEYPMHLIDLMVLCWSHDPTDRPSASDILRMSARSEFYQLLSCVSLEEGYTVCTGCSAPRIEQDIQEFEFDIFDTPMDIEQKPPLCDIWLATRSPDGVESNIYIYTYDQQQCVEARKISLGVSFIRCMCQVGQYMWCADHLANIHVFSMLTYTEVLKFPVSDRPKANIRSMAYSSNERQVYVVLENGSFILCHSDIPMNVESGYNPVKTQCPGTGKTIHSMTMLHKDNGTSELWCGQSHGKISIWNLHNTSGGLKRVSHVDKDPKSAFDVINITSSPGDSSRVWTYVYPGTIVYKWNAKTKRLATCVDMSNVLPSNTPDRFCYKPDRLTVGKSQVTAMRVVKDYLLLGTTMGCFAVLEKDTLNPLSIIPSHKDEGPFIRTILPLVVTDFVPTNEGEAEDELTNQSPKEISLPMVITVGKGYNDLVGEVMPQYNAIRSSKVNYMLCWSVSHWGSNDS